MERTVSPVSNFGEPVGNKHWERTLTSGDLREEPVARRLDHHFVEPFVQLEPTVEVARGRLPAEDHFPDRFPFGQQGLQFRQFMVGQETSCLACRKGLEQFAHVVDFRNFLAVECPNECPRPSHLFHQSFLAKRLMASRTGIRLVPISLAKERFTNWAPDLNLPAKTWWRMCW